jgi:hypothetical protein
MVNGPELQHGRVSSLHHVVVESYGACAFLSSIESVWFPGSKCKSQTIIIKIEAAGQFNKQQAIEQVST